jgi:peptide/nickel transport system ATP-binding protein
MTDTTTQATPPSGDERDVLVDVRGVKVHFPIKRGVIFDKVVGHVYAVDGVDLQIRRGETYGLVGESGCGKSTLGKAILNLEPPTEGSVIFDGTDIAIPARGGAASAPQGHPDGLPGPDEQPGPPPVGGVTARRGHACHGLDTDGASTKKRLRELLAAVGLPAAALTKYPHEFSGGQRQRIGIARALSVEPKLIVADEPVSALDVSVQAQVINLLEELQDEFDLTYLVVAHDLAVVRHISDRIGVMYLGGLVEEAGADDLYASPCIPTRARCCRRCRYRTRPSRTPASRSCSRATCPRRPTRHPGAGSTPAARGARRPAATTSGPQLRVVQIDGVDPSHRVACHWVEQIASGEIRPHEVAPVYVAPGDGDAGAIDDDTFTGPASVTEVI